MSNSGIVLELQKDCLDSKTPVSSILRRAKVIASKLGLEDLKQWIDQELNGYDCTPQELPQHRKGIGQPKYFNPYNGWQHIQTADDWFGNAVRTVFLMQSVSEIEHLVTGGKTDTLQMSYNPSIVEAIQGQLPMRTEVALHFSKSEAIAALDFVRNKTLDWTLELEQKGITGDGLTFESDQKREAQVVTNHIYGGNFGVLGAVSGDANNSGFISISGPISDKQIDTLVAQIRQAIPALPIDSQSDVERIVGELEAEAASPNQSPNVISKAFGSLRSILEGASGNLAAQGILTAIAALASG